MNRLLSAFATALFLTGYAFEAAGEVMDSMVEHNRGDAGISVKPRENFVALKDGDYEC